MYDSEGNFVKNFINYMLNKLTLYPSTLGEMCRYRLKQLDKYIYPTLAEFIYSTMAVYHTDLSLSTLKEIFTEVFKNDWDEVAYFTYKFILRGMVEILDDNLCFTHSIIKDTALACVPNDTSKEYRKAIIKALKCNTNIEMIEVVFQLFYLQDFTALLILKDTVNNKDINKYYEAVIYAAEYFLLYGFSSCSEDFPVKNLVETLSQNKVGSLVVFQLLVGLNLTANFNKFPKEIIDFYKYSITKLDCLVNEKQKNEYFIFNKILICDHILDYAVNIGAEVHIRDLLSSMNEIYWNINIEILSHEGKEKYTDCLYRLALAYQSIDELHTATDIYNKLTEGVLKQKIFFHHISSLVDYYINSKKMDIARRLCDEGIIVYKSRKGSLINYANCLYKRFYIALHAKDYETAINYGQQAYDVFFDFYTEDPVNMRNLYSYSVGCAAMDIVCSLLKQPDRSDEYRLKCYELRKYLLSIDSNVYMYLSSFTNICLTIVSSKDSYNHEYRTEVLNSAFTAITEYARHNNNLRAAWMFTNLYTSMQEMEDMTEVLIGNLKHFDKLVDIIVSNNSPTNSDRFNNLNEICGMLINIFKIYCEQKNLPLEKGKAFLDIALKIAKIMVEIEINEKSINNISNVAAEMSTIYKQQTISSFGENSFVKDHKIYATRIYEKDKGNPFCVLLYISALQSELLPLLFIQLDLQNDPKRAMMMNMIMSQMNLNTFKMILDNINEQIILLNDIADKVNIQQNILLMMQAGCELVKKSDTASIDDKQRATGIILMIKKIL